MKPDDLEDDVEPPEGDAWFTATKKPVEVEARGPYTDPTVVETIEGDFEVTERYVEEHEGYYIIRGVQGEVYPCGADIFHETYEVGTQDVSDAELDDAIDAAHTALYLLNGIQTRASERVGADEDRRGARRAHTYVRTALETLCDLHPDREVWSGEAELIEETNDDN